MFYCSFELKHLLGCSNDLECCQVLFFPSWFQWLAQQIRSGPGAGLSIWKKRRPSQLLLNYSKRYFISKSHFNLTSLFSALLGLLITSVFLWQHQSFPQSRNGFKVGMKLEGLDPCHPSLFCVLSVAEVRMRCTLDSVCSLLSVKWHARRLSLPVRSRVTGWGSILTVTQNATTSGQTLTRGTWNQLAGVRRTGISYCCLKVKNKRTRNVWLCLNKLPSLSAFF